MDRRVYVSLEDYTRAECDEALDNRGENEKIADMLYDGVFLDFFYPTIGGINDYDAPINRYGEPEEGDDEEK